MEDANVAFGRRDDEQWGLSRHIHRCAKVKSEGPQREQDAEGEQLEYKLVAYRSSAREG